MSKTNDDKISEIHGDIKVIMSKLENLTDWLNKHEASDQKHFNRIYNKISGLMKYSTGLVAVGACIGYFVGK